MHHGVQGDVVYVIERRDMHVERHQLQARDGDADAGAADDLTPGAGVVSPTHEPRRNTYGDSGQEESACGAYQPDGLRGIAGGDSACHQECAHGQVDTQPDCDETQRPGSDPGSGVKGAIGVPRWQKRRRRFAGSRPVRGGGKAVVAERTTRPPRCQPVIDGYQQRCDDAAGHRNPPYLETWRSRYAIAFASQM